MKLLEAHIEVDDLERSRVFYTRLLPHERLVEFKDGNAVALVFADGTSFGIWKKGKVGLHGGRGGRHVHIAFEISKGEYDSFRDKLQSMSVKYIEHDWPNGRKSLYFFDPDGHQAELMTGNWLDF